MSTALGAVGLAAFLTSLIVSFLAVQGRVLDLPNSRSAHTNPTPRAAGLGLIAGLGAGALAASLFPISAGSLGAILLVTGLFAALGFADDLFDLSEGVKFVVFVVLCLVMVWVAGPVMRLGLTLDWGFELPIWLAFAGSTLFVFVVVNSANFMDGSDAMLIAVMGPAAAGLGVAGLVAGELSTTVIGVALAGGCGAFLVFNRPPAKAFAGDVGALGVGAAYAGAALAMAGQGFSGSLWLAPMFVLVFLADVLLTLLRRAVTGRLKLTAHSEHAYQRLIRAGWSHGAMALIYGGLTIAIVATGLVAAQGPDGSVPIVFGAWVAILTGLYLAAGRLTPEEC